MSFWDMSDGGNAAKEETAGEFEMGGSMEPIPNDTTCIAYIEEASWDGYQADRYISIKWRVAEPEEYAKRVLFQKVKVFGTSQDKDPAATADKAKRMLAAIDHNAGGKLSKVSGEPTDEDLMTALAGKMMVIKVMVWKFTPDGGEEKTGNWIAAVAPVKKGAAKQSAAQEPRMPTADDFKEDIGF